MVPSALRKAVFCLLAILLPVNASAALIVREYDPNRHDRFLNHADFLGASYDWSGVGRANDGLGWGTLVSPTFMISASHFSPSGTVRFYESNDPNGNFEERDVIAKTALRQGTSPFVSDLSILELSAPINNAVFYPILDHMPGAGAELIVFGLSNTTPAQTNMRVGRNHLDEVLTDFSHPNLGSRQGDVFIYGYDETGGIGGDEARVQGGDSGAPSFTIVNGQPVVLGIHWFRFDPGDFPGLGFGSGDTLVSSFASEMNSVMAAAGSSERVTVLAAVPEPSSLLLVGLVVVLVPLRQRSSS